MTANGWRRLDENHPVATRCCPSAGVARATPQGRRWAISSLTAVADEPRRRVARTEPSRLLKASATVDFPTPLTPLRRELGEVSAVESERATLLKDLAGNDFMQSREYFLFLLVEVVSQLGHQLGGAIEQRTGRARIVTQLRQRAFDLGVLPELAVSSGVPVWQIATNQGVEVVVKDPPVPTYLRHERRDVTLVTVGSVEVLHTALEHTVFCAQQINQVGLTGLGYWGSHYAASP